MQPFPAIRSTILRASRLTKVTLIFVALFLALPRFYLHGQESSPVQQLSLLQGLSHNTVLCILQDQEGYMWLGTQYGLNRYDGYTFTSFRYQDGQRGSLSSSYIQTCFRDRKGTLWIGTWGGGLNRFDPKTHTFRAFRHHARQPGSLSSNDVNAIAEDSTGCLWIATGNGLNRFDPSSGTFTVFQHQADNPQSLSSNNVSALCIDRSGTLWVGTWGGGLNRFNPQKGSFTRFQHEPGKPGSLLHNIVRAIYQDRAGALWIGTWGGLNRLDPQKQTFTAFQHKASHPGSLPHNYVSALVEDTSGQLWVGTWGGGLARLNRQTNQFDSPPLAGSASQQWVISTLFTDREGNLWVGTTSAGAYHLLPREVGFTSFRNTSPGDRNRARLSNDNVRTLYPARDGRIWVGTEIGLNQFDPRTGSFRVYKQEDVFAGDPGNFARAGSLSNHTITALTETRAGRFWVGTRYGGLNRFDRKQGTFKAFRPVPGQPGSLSHEHVTALLEDRAGVLWIGTFGGGLNRLDQKDTTFSHFRSRAGNALGSDSITALYEDHRGTLWIATRRGLTYQQKGVFYRLSPKVPWPLRAGPIHALHEDHQGRLWIGTETGLFRYDPVAGSTQAYARDLPSQVIYGVVEDGKHQLWLSTDKGLYRLDVARGTYLTFDTPDGLQGSLFNPGAYCRTSTGHLYFGGVSGFSTFHPDSLSVNQLAPPLRLTRVLVSDKPISPDSLVQAASQLTLSHREGFLALTVSALSYGLPERNTYQYRLEGLEKEWVRAGSRREAIYMNLAPGRYVFYARASNNHGVWSPGKALLRVVVTPPWWGTWWARTGFILTGSLLLGLAYQLRTRRIRSQNRILTEKVAERTQQIVSQRDELEQLNGQIRQQNQALEQQVKLRTESLQEALRVADQQNQALQRTNQDLDTFVYLASHDLKGPVVNLEGLLARLTRKLPGRLDETEQQLFNFAQQSVGRLKRTIQELADIARIQRDTEAGEALDLAALLEEVLIDLGSMVEQSGGKIHHDLQAVLVYFPRNHLRSVLYNLLSNAVKYRSPERPLLIRIRSWQKREQVCLSVTDNGLGLSPEQQPKLFTMFKRLHAHVEGSGIGLYMIKRMLENHGGSISVESQLDEGTTFTVSFPAHRLAL